MLCIVADGGSVADAIASDRLGQVLRSPTYAKYRLVTVIVAAGGLLGPLLVAVVVGFALWLGPWFVPVFLLAGMLVTTVAASPVSYTAAKGYTRVLGE